MVKVKDFKIFLIKAKTNTYASSGEGGKKILPDNSKELEYRDENFYYRDRYFGFNPFIGEEVIFYKKKVVWGMSYYGRVVSKKISPKEVYVFLKKALKKITKDKPFRGPSNFKEGDFEYINTVEGSIDKFRGGEKIYNKRELVYELDYHGGLVDNNCYK